MDPLSPLTWQALEYHHEPKSVDWFWAVGIIALCIAVTSVIYGDILFAILVLIGAGSLAIYAVREPELVQFELNEKGVRIDRKLYPYATLESFWVEEHRNVHPRPKLLIKSQKITMPLIVIPIEEIHPDDIRNFILNYLPEEEHYEPLSQKLMEYLGF
ncbi:MAG TPA: hypothetical protein VFA52_03210 [Candidatus Paceibacterota bacterium]|nr:hypothetical protein [Candidatus Paceibacterota bacterium]